MAAGLSFLVVEDDEPVRRMIARVLRQHGTVEQVATLVAARRELRDRQYHGVIIDVDLPDGNGLDVIEHAQRRSPASYILVLTGTTDHGVIKRVHAEGAFYLLKPADAKALETFVAESRKRRDVGRRRSKVTLQRWAEDYGLSSKETELLELGIEGVPREEISRIRGVQPNTVKKQIQLLLQKTGDDTFEAAVRSLLREALDEPT